MRNLNFFQKELCERNPDGSFGTRADRLRMLNEIAETLYRLGFRQMTQHSLRPKHVQALLDAWNAAGLATGTVKNRMSALRWWAEKIGKANVIKRSNRSYGIPDRNHVALVSKAKIAQPEEKARITDPYTAMSLKLIAAFGLRRAESIKICPAWADLGDRLRLKSSWCKGGRYREIPILSLEQRAVLDEAIAMAGEGSLIPPEMNYKQQLQRFRYQCDKAGIRGVHGIRHRYAQTRYSSLAGWDCPVKGGPVLKALSPAQRARDREVRLTISQELGHGREQVVSAYLGR